MLTFPRLLLPLRLPQLLLKPLLPLGEQRLLVLLQVAALRTAEWSTRDRVVASREALPPAGAVATGCSVPVGATRRGAAAARAAARAASVPVLVISEAF